MNADEFPKHEASLHLTHNQHRAYCETVESAIKSGTYNDDKWVSRYQRQKSIETECVWELQWYPNTPIASLTLLACDLDVLLTVAKRGGLPTNCGLPDPSEADCPNMKEVGGGIDGELYRCEVCGKRYYLDYEEMR